MDMSMCCSRPEPIPAHRPEREKLEMKNALLAAVAAIVLAAPAHATSDTDLMCTVTDTLGNSLIYTFDGNRGDDGSMVETGFDKNGKSVFSRVGQRPIWFVHQNSFAGMTLRSDDAPDWALVLKNIRGPKSNLHAEVVLTHSGRLAGRGTCGRSLEAVRDNGNSADVVDNGE